MSQAKEPRQRSQSRQWKRHVDRLGILLTTALLLSGWPAKSAAGDEKATTAPKAAPSDGRAVPPPAGHQPSDSHDWKLPFGSADIQLFGKMDADIEWVNTSEPGAGVAASRFRVASNASRIGVRGTAQFEGKVHAIWQIASRISLNGTETGGGGGLFTLWGNSRVGLDTPYGLVFVGIWDTPFRQSYDTVDLFDTSHIASPIALLGSIGNGISGSSALPTSAQGMPGVVASDSAASTCFYRKQKNSLQYWSPRIWNMRLKLAYSGDDSAAKSAGIDPSIVSVMAAYDKSPLYVAAAYERHKDLKAMGGVNQAGGDYGTRLIGSYRVRALTMALVYEFLSFGGRSGIQATSRDALSFSGSYRWRAHSLAGVYTYASDLSGGYGTGARQISSRYGYSLSRSVELYTQYTTILNRPNGTYNYGDGLTTSTRPGSMLSGVGTGLAFSF